VPPRSGRSCPPPWRPGRGRAPGSARRGGGGAGAPPFEQPPGVARREPVHDPPLDRLVGQFAPGPVADRARRGRRGLARQRGEAATCSAVRRHGPPGRGASASRSATPNSSGGSAASPSQRVRHSRAVSASTPSARPRAAVFTPSAAARMIRARSATCCGVRCAPARASRSRRSAAVRATVGGFGPRSATSSPPTHTTAHSTTGLFTARCASTMGQSAYTRCYAAFPSRRRPSKSDGQAYEQ